MAFSAAQATRYGWFGFMGALGSMLMLVAGDIANLQHYSDILVYPAIGAGLMVHVGSVIVAFASGKSMPTKRSGRSSDRKGDLRNVDQPPH